MSIKVTSEFGRLHEAIVHRPGRELARMTPSTRDYFLFDDLLSDEHARQEHDWLTELLRDHLGIKVHYFDEMLAEALRRAPEEERRLLIAQVRQLESDLPPVEQRIGQLEVLVRWFQGHGWPQYTHDPEGDPNAAAPGSGPGAIAALHKRDTRAEHSGSRQVPSAPSPLESGGSESSAYLQYRLQGWSEEGDFGALARDLVEGIEARLEGASPTQTPGPEANGNEPHPHAMKGAIRIATGEDADALRRFVEGRLFYLTPLPNLMFVHDVGTTVLNQLLLGRMAAPGRARETLLFDFVHRNHPRFEGVYRWTWADARVNDPAWPVASSPFLHLEGGNVVQLRENLIVLGVGQRTSLESVQRVADSWRAYAMRMRKKLTLYILRLPAGFNHLDSVLGVINHNECVVYPPVFEPYGPASVDVVRAELSADPVRPTRSDDFFESLRQDGVDLHPIPCGGPDPVNQQREQWFSGVNMLAVAPGKVIIYRSAERTIEELARRGYNVVDANDVLMGAVKLSLSGHDKWALKIKGSELSRGHGGPHSLVLPLVRDGA
jgi:arginine deiminase